MALQFWVKLAHWTLWSGKVRDQLVAVFASCPFGATSPRGGKTQSTNIASAPTGLWIGQTSTTGPLPCLQMANIYCSSVSFLMMRYIISNAVTGAWAPSGFLQKTFRDLWKVVQGCTTVTRPKVASVTSYVQILTSCSITIVPESPMLAT